MLSRFKHSINQTAAEGDEQKYETGHHERVKQKCVFPFLRRPTTPPRHQMNRCGAKDMPCHVTLMKTAGQGCDFVAIVRQADSSAFRRDSS